MSLAMPFIDDDLLWCPDNDGKMVDLSSCLQDAVAVGQQAMEMASLGELTQSDLTSLDTGLTGVPEQINDTDDIFKQLNETNFELDKFFNDLANTPEIKEENNNDLPNEQNNVPTNNNNSNLPTKHLLEMRTASRRFNIAAANPLLAEKLASSSNQSQQQLQDQIMYQNRLQNDGELVLKQEKGELHKSSILLIWLV